MEIKPKYQYTYFIKDFVIKEEKYDKYILKLIKDKNCKLKIFEKEKDYDIYTYFLKNVRNYVFDTFNFSKDKIETLNKFDDDMKATILSKVPCISFEYNINNNIQGKMGTEEGIFFSINKIEIVCFNTGICFLVMKTHLENLDDFADILKFNYKFKDITSEYSYLSEYEKINLQTDSFSDIKELKDLIFEITSGINQRKNLQDEERSFYTYAYLCVDETCLNEKVDFKEIETDFMKFAHVLNYNSTLNYNSNYAENKINIMSNLDYIKYGFTKTGVALITSSTEIYNYTKLPNEFERKYLYTYIIALYQKIYMQELKAETKNKKKINSAIKKFIKFIKNIWVSEVTNDDSGSLFYTKIRQVLGLNELYDEIKSDFAIMYKQESVEKNSKLNIVIIAIFILSIIANILCLAMYK